MRPALEQDRRDPEAPELVERRSARAPARSRRSPRSPRRRRPRARRSPSAARRARRRRSAAPRPRGRRAARRRGSRASESKTTRRGWWWTFSTRAVSCGSSVSAVPMPIATASTDARQWCARSRLSTPEIHFESPSRVATLPSSVIADLKRTQGRPVRACLRKAWLSSRALCASSPSATSDLDALVAQDPEAAPGRLEGRVVAGDDDAADPRRQDRVGAGRRAGPDGSTARARRTASPRRDPRRRRPRSR